MAIKVIDEPDVYLTRAQIERYRHEYQQAMMFRVDPPTFEAWVARKVVADRKPMKERFHAG